MSDIRRLKQFYKKLPNLPWDPKECGIKPWSMLEVERAKAVSGRYPHILPNKAKVHSCVYNTPQGCAIWNVRPMWCRANIEYKMQHEQEVLATMKEYFTWAKKQGPIYIPIHMESYENDLQEMFGPGLKFISPRISTREQAERGKKAYVQMLATLAMVSGMTPHEPIRSNR